MKYAFIKGHQARRNIRRLCQLFDVHPSGYYAWLKKPKSARTRENERLVGHIKQHWLESGGVYGYRRRPHHRSGEPSVIAPNLLEQQFTTTAPDLVWVTDITHSKTHEGWLYLAVVLDLFSRRIVGWSMKPRITRDIVLDALLMAVWRRNPTRRVIVHSDQGSQYTSHDWRSFIRDNKLEISMSRRGNCHDNAVAESFFQLLKRERIKRRIYTTRSAARADVFDYIEMFYNRKRRHGFNNQLSPVVFEEQFNQRLESV